MGTRGTIGFKSDQKYRLAYNHFDSYPSGLGKETIEALQKVKDFLALKKKVKALKTIDEESKPTAKDLKHYAEFRDENVNGDNGENPSWYSLLRNLQGAVMINAVEDGSLQHITDTEFIKDSLFCEYGYIVNLDTMQLDLFLGFQKEPQENNPFGQEASDGGYYPCRHIGSLPLDNLSYEELERVFKEHEKE